MTLVSEIIRRIDHDALLLDAEIRLLMVKGDYTAAQNLTALQVGIRNAIRQYFEAIRHQSAAHRVESTQPERREKRRSKLNQNLSSTS